jgi:hypothetical protein
MLQSAAKVVYLVLFYVLDMQNHCQTEVSADTQNVL